MMVGPTKRKPCFLSALLSASASGVTAGTSERDRKRLMRGSPSTKSQTKLSRLVPASRRSR